MSGNSLRHVRNGPVTVTFSARDSYYGDMKKKTVTYKDEYEATVALSNYCKDSRFHNKIESVSRSGIGRSSHCGRR